MKKQKKRFCDRNDAKRIKDIDPFHSYMAYLMPNRCDAEVYINEKIDITNLLKYIDKINSGEKNITLFHAFLTACAKIIYHRPYLNRYIANKKYYMRDEISFGFVAKKKFSDKGEEALVILRPGGNSNLFSINEEITKKVSKVRDENDGYAADGALKIVSKLPKFIMEIFMAALRFCDRHGFLPKALYDVDTHFVTVLISNLGSVKCDAVYHHLNNFGTNGIVMTIGTIHKEQVVCDDESVKIRDIVNVSFTIDERIADGFYFAKSIKYFKHIIENPQLLEKPIKEMDDYEF